MTCQKIYTFFGEHLKQADAFTIPAYLTLNKKRTLNTVLGGSLTIALVAFIISQTIPPLVDMTQHNGPRLYQITELESEPAEILLSKSSNFFLGIIVTIADINCNLTKASPFNFRTTFNKYTRQLDGSRIKVKYPVYWAPCNKSDFPDEIYGKNAYQTYTLDYGYCAYAINFTHPQTGECPLEFKQFAECLVPPSFDIEGTFLSGEFDFIQSNTAICKQSDPTLPYGMVCDTGDIVSKFQKEVYKLNLYYAYTLISPNNYEAPNKTLIDVVYWRVNPYIAKVADIFVDRITIQDFDDYIFTERYRNRSYYSINSDSMREMETVGSKLVTNLAQWNMRRSSQILVTVRTYQKIQEILADLGGFSKTLIVIASCIAVGYVRYKYSMLVSNQLYEFKRPAPNSNHKNKKAAPDLKAMNGLSALEFSENKVLMPGSPVSCESPFSLLNFDENKVITDYFENRKMLKPLPVNEWAYFKALFSWLKCRRNIEENLAKKGRAFSSDKKTTGSG